jgi:hypothetical protein
VCAMKNKTVLVSCLVASTLSLGCSQGNRLVVINESNSPLHDVLVSGSGFSERIGTIAPHGEARLVVRPRGESGLQIQFNVDGKPVSLGPEGYFEGTGGYLITATVSRDLGLSVKSEASLY